MKQQYLKFVGGPLNGQVQGYGGDPDGPGTWKVRVNDEKLPGKYKQKGQPEKGVITLVWREEELV